MTQIEEVCHTPSPFGGYEHEDYGFIAFPDDGKGYGDACERQDFARELHEHRLLEENRRAELARAPATSPEEVFTQDGTYNANFHQVSLSRQDGDVLFGMADGFEFRWSSHTGEVLWPHDQSFKKYRLQAEKPVVAPVLGGRFETRGGSVVEIKKQISSTGSFTNDAWTERDDPDASGPCRVRGIAPNNMIWNTQGYCTALGYGNSQSVTLRRGDLVKRLA